jgi:hypothetical protein
MSTAHATGTAALLLSINPGLSGDQVEEILEQAGVLLEDPRNQRVTPRIDALAAARRVWNLTSPILGGGSARTDCLVTWRVDAERVEQARAVAQVNCTDGDAACDADEHAGVCGFDVSVCFNHADPRVPVCSTASPITSYNLVEPNDSSADAQAAAEADTFAQVLAGLFPVAEPESCADSVRITVPAGAARRIRFAAFAEDGRRDYDRIRLACGPAQ